MLSSICRTTVGEVILFKNGTVLSLDEGTTITFSEIEGTQNCFSAWPTSLKSMLTRDKLISGKSIKFDFAGALPRKQSDLNDVNEDIFESLVEFLRPNFWEQRSNRY